MQLFNKVKKLNQNAKDLRKQLYYDRGDYRKTVILVGSGRSGTTWAGDLINYNNEYRIMFEPFHSLKNPLISHWKYRQYIRPDNYNDIFLNPAHSILSGNIRNSWIDQFNKKIFPNKRLIKDIRITFCLKWIKHNFPEIPIIYLLRHPCAVAHSKIKKGWGDHLNEIMSQNDLIDDHLRPFDKYIYNAKDKFEKYIYLWCIENYIPLKQFNNSEIMVVFYENLCINPKIEIKKIFSFLNQKHSLEACIRSNRPSALCRKDSPIKFGGNLINNWRNNIDNYHIQKTVQICNIFGLDKIYNETSYPLVDNNDVLNLFE